MVCKTLLRALVQAPQKGYSILCCSSQTCAFPDTPIWTVQTFILAAVHFKLATLAVVGVYLFEPISASPDDPQVLQVRIVHEASLPSTLLHQRLLAAARKGHLHVFMLMHSSTHEQCCADTEQ